MKNWQTVYWQIVWFFSMEDAAQEALFGSTEKQWFIEEDEQNSGANYLIGLCYAFLEIGYPSSTYTGELKDAVLAILDHLEPRYWSFKSLVTTPEWARVRAAATELLRVENTRVTMPRKPFVIENLIHVDHYQHASKVRAGQRKRKRETKKE